MADWAWIVPMIAAWLIVSLMAIMSFRAWRRDLDRPDDGES